jgi:hypothetical protein
MFFQEPINIVKTLYNLYLIFIFNFKFKFFCSALVDQRSLQFALINKKIACEPQKTELKYLIQKQAQKSLKDSHLWLSIFNRPVNSSFTCLDRVTCGMVFITYQCL